MIDMGDRFLLEFNDVVVLFADLQARIIKNSGINPPKLIEIGAEALAGVADSLNLPKLFSVVPEGGGPATHLQAL